jgi:adenosylcobinamide kinase / adenosylcobinamide-phosphate guanylyltransferase
MEDYSSLPLLSLILGGARSGKSTYAQSLAEQHGGKVFYVATAAAGDKEMAERISVHRASRPPQWITLEAQHRVGEAVLVASKNTYPDLILLDCLTILTSNVIMALPEPLSTQQAQNALAEEIEAILDARQKLQVPWLVVSNEVGMGLVPPYPLGRVYRDVLGWANQRLAAAAERVVLMVAGIPMKVKG